MVNGLLRFDRKLLIALHAKRKIGWMDVRQTECVQVIQFFSCIINSLVRMCCGQEDVLSVEK